MNIWKSVGVLAIAFFLGVAPVLATHEQPVAEGADPPTDWKKGKLGHLAQFIGTYMYEHVLEDPEVSKKLYSLLGGEAQHLVKNMQVRSPINFEGGELVLHGSIRGPGKIEAAMLTVGLYKGKINAVIFSEGEVTLYSRSKKYDWVPTVIRQRIRFDDTNSIVEAPPLKNFRWVGQSMP